MTGFTSPNHTQTPNDLFDVHMLDMSEAELKVTLAIIRKTLGYHKKSDPISLTQLQKLTGLSRQAVSDGTAAAIKRGLIQVVGTGKRGVIIYGLVINSYQSIEATNVPVDQSKILDSTSLQSRHTKETTSKETKKGTCKRDPFYDAIATVWKSSASGWIANIKGMMLGTAKSGQWAQCKFDPPVTDAAEILAFAPYMERRKREKKIDGDITACVTIQRWFYDFRNERDNPRNVLSVLDGLRIVS